MEPILTPSLNRFCLHPVKYENTYALYKKQVACFWSVDEVDLGADVNDWEKLSNAEKETKKRSSNNKQRRRQH